METEEIEPRYYHFMFKDVSVRLIPQGSGHWRFSEDKDGVLDVTWVQKDLEALAKMTVEEQKVFSLKEQAKE